MPITLPLPARLTRDEVVTWVRSVQPQFQEAKNHAEPIQVDASALKQFDSSALAALLAVRREAQQQGVVFAGVVGMSATLRSLADVYGIDELLGEGHQRPAERS